MTVAGWQAIVSSGMFVSAGLIQGLISLNNPEYVPQPWQTMLLSYAIILFSITINTIVSRALPKIECLILIFHVLGFFTILVPVVYLAPHTTASDVFNMFLNEGGFKTQGLSFFVGLVGIAFCFLGNDSTI